MRRALLLTLTLTLVVTFTLMVFGGWNTVHAHAEKGTQEYEKVANPIEATEETIAEGKSIYLQKCATCHGADGKGSYPGMPDLTDHQMMSEMSEALMFQRISKGVQGTSMPPWEDILTEEERWMVVNYLNTLHHPGNEEAPVAEVAVSAEEQAMAAAPKKGVCGPTVLLALGTLPAVLYGLRGRRGHR